MNASALRWATLVYDVIEKQRFVGTGATDYRSDLALLFERSRQGLPL
jgi:hypothetical protein